MTLFLSFIIALSITILVEGFVVGLITRNKRVIYCSSLCNLLTNPALNLIFFFNNSLPDDYTFLGLDYSIVSIIILELLVVIVEAYIYFYMCRIKYPKALLISFAANLASFASGLIFTPIIDNFTYAFFL